MIRRKNIEKDSRDSFVMTSYQPSAIADRVMGIVPVKCELIKCYESHVTAAGQTCTYSIEHLTSTETSGAGDVITTAESLEGAAETPHAADIITTSNLHQFAAGDRVGVHMNGTTTTTLAGFMVTCQFLPID
jgi:hypothetical protein